MIKGIDHIVILVRDLNKAIRDYTDLGFTVVQGGEHAGGASHNALVAFADGSYLELIAFKGEVPKEHPFYRAGVSEGLITYALLPDDIEQTVAAAQERGLEMAPPRSGGRLRPDGKRLEWQTSYGPSYDLPFLCYDITPRELRVPGSDVQTHKNGVTGIVSVGVAVSDITESRRRYEALLGQTAHGENSSDDDAIRSSYQVAETSIVLAQPRNDKQLKEHLQQHGEGPYMLELRTSAEGSQQKQARPEKSHSVMLTFTGLYGK